MNCGFCGHEIPKGTGTIYVTKRGRALYFCSSKCRKNLLELKRKPRRVRWTDEYCEEKSIRVKSLTSSGKEEEGRTGETVGKEKPKKPVKKKGAKKK